MKKRFSEEQIVAILREAESGDKTVAELALQHGISEPTFYAWRRKYGGMQFLNLLGGWLDGVLWDMGLLW